MTQIAPTRAFALSNFYALDRLDVPGREAKANLAGKCRAAYGPTSFADSCGERLPIEPAEMTVRFLSDAAAPPLAFDALLRGDSAAPMAPVEALAALLRYTYGLLRWEPFNDYKQHRAIPSPRSLYPLDLYLVCREGAVRVHRYLPDYHALAECRDLTAPHGIDQGIVIVSRLGLLPPYGELTPTLTSVEAGALGAQIVSMARVVGCRATIDPASDPAALRTALRLDHWSDCPAAAIEIDGSDFGSALNEIAAVSQRLMVRSSRGAAMEAHSRLRDFVRRSEDIRPLPAAADAPARLERPLPMRGTPRSSGGFVAIVNRRSSGCRVGGMVGEAAPADHPGIAALLDDAIALGRLRRDWAGPRVRLFMTVFNDRDFAPGDYELCLDTATCRKIAQADRGAVHTFEAYYEINFASLAAAFTFGCDLGGPDAAHPAFFRHVHQRAGERVQDLSIAASASGLFARPYRSFRGPVHQALLDVACEPLIQVLVGISRRVNPGISRVAR